MDAVQVVESTQPLPPRQSLLDGVPSLLSWKAGLGPVRDACRGHIRWAFYRLKLWSSETDFVTQVQNLPVTRQQQLLLSPLTHHQLFLHTAPPAVIQEELMKYLSGEDEGVQDLIAEADTTLLIPGRDSIRCSSRGPAVSILPDGGFGEVREATPEELRLGDERLAAAVNLIADVSPIALTVLSSCVHLLVRTSLEDSHAFSSSSQRNIIGRTTLGNAHSPFHDVERVADALVHEATHALLYKIELLEPIFTDLSIASQKRTTSLWTGRSLAITSFVHACFVWYALANFWTVCLERGHDTSQVISRLRKACDGFRERPDLSIFVPEFGVEAKIRDLVIQMWDNVPRYV